MMPNYRCSFVPGGTFFFTVNLLERRTNLLVDDIDALRQATLRTMRRCPFRIDALRRAPRPHPRGLDSAVSRGANAASGSGA
jgi:REP element-mobilizing transposase RayT